MSILVVGSSGYFGRTLLHALRDCTGVIPTHHQNAMWPSSLAYDFWADDFRKLLTETAAEIVVLALEVEGRVEDSGTNSLFHDRVEALVTACKDLRVVYLSTDAVFSGDRGQYTEKDQPAPRTLYGEHTFAFEQRIRQACADYVIIRPSYLYGFSLGTLDNRLDTTRRKLTAGEQVEYFGDMFKSPIPVQMAAEATKRIALGNFNGDIHIGGPRTSVFRFHSDAMKSLGVPTEGLKESTIPEKSNFLRDTSLTTHLMTEITGLHPVGVEQGIHEFS